MADWREDFARRLERQKDKSASTLVSIYRQAGREILGSLLSLDDSSIDAFLQGQILAQILPILQRLNTRATMELGTALTTAYKAAQKQVFRLALLRDHAPPEVGVGVQFNRIPEERVRAVAESSLEYIQAIDADLKARIRQQMGVSLVRGETPREMAKRIVGQGLTTDGGHPSFHTAEVRADVIARTETARVQAQTITESIRQVAEVNPGVLMEWCAALERACPTCRALDGLKAPAGETFNGYTVPRHPRCRCVIVPYVPK